MHANKLWIVDKFLKKVPNKMSISDFQKLNIVIENYREIVHILF